VNGMGRKKHADLIGLGCGILIVVIVFLAFIVSSDRIREQERERSRLRFEASLRQTAVSCYAEEGFYPPDLAYIEKYYGIRIPYERYAVHYEVFAENLMPEISVVELP